MYKLTQKYQKQINKDIKKLDNCNMQEVIKIQKNAIEMHKNIEMLTRYNSQLDDYSLISEDDYFYNKSFIETTIRDYKKLCKKLDRINYEIMQQEEE